MRSTAANAAVVSLGTSANDNINDNDDDDDDSGKSGVVESACSGAVAKKDSSTRLRRRTTTAAAANALIAPSTAAAVAAERAERAADRSPEEKEPDFSDMKFGQPAQTRTAGHREKSVVNGKVEVFSAPQEDEGVDGIPKNDKKTGDDGADANKQNDKTVDCGSDADKKIEKTVERRRSEVVGRNSSNGCDGPLQEGLGLTQRPDTVVGFVDNNLGDKCADDAEIDVVVARQGEGVDSLRCSGNPTKEKASSSNAQELKNRGLFEAKNGDEPAEILEGVVEVPVFNRGRCASREGERERNYRAGWEGRDNKAFARGGGDEEEEEADEGEEEGKDDRVWRQGGGKEANEDQDDRVQGEEEEEANEGKEDGEEDKEEEEEEERAQTEEEQRASLETSVRLLRLVLASNCLGVSFFYCCWRPLKKASRMSDGFLIEFNPGENNSMKYVCSCRTIAALNTIPVSLKHVVRTISISPEYARPSRFSWPPEVYDPSLLLTS